MVCQRRSQVSWGCSYCWPFLNLSIVGRPGHALHDVLIAPVRCHQHLTGEPNPRCSSPHIRSFDTTSGIVDRLNARYRPAVYARVTSIAAGLLNIFFRYSSNPSASRKTLAHEMIWLRATPQRSIGVSTRNKGSTTPVSCADTPVLYRSVRATSTIPEHCHSEPEAKNLPGGPKLTPDLRIRTNRPVLTRSPNRR